MAGRDDLLNNAQRKKAARKQRKQNERLAHRNLDEVTGHAVALALELAPAVADAPSATESERVVDVELASRSEAEFVRKRINDAFNIGEWLGDVRVWVWDATEHHRAPLSDRGRELGVEVRLEQARRAE